MPLSIDFSSDYLLWDYPEAVTFRSQAPLGTYTPTTISIANRGQPNYKERSPTQGVYAGVDLHWLLPGLLLGSTSPKPGDQIQDGAGVLWTVLTQDYDQADKVWGIYAVNLSLAYRLLDWIDIQRPTITSDSVGGVVRHWPDGNATGVSAGGSTPYQGINARVQLLTAQEAEERDIRGFRKAFAVTVDQQVSLTAEDRVHVLTGTYAGTYLDITGLHNPTRIDELPVLDCVQPP